MPASVFFGKQSLDGRCFYIAFLFAGPRSVFCLECIGHSTCFEKRWVCGGHAFRFFQIGNKTVHHIFR